MGYTHYLRQKETVNQADWADFTAEVKAIIEASNVPVAHESDTPAIPPQIDGELVRFNGIGEDGHETFLIDRQVRDKYEYEDAERHQTEGAFSFCKTARKPYDEIVVAILAVVTDRFPKAFGVGSDGEAEEWADGIALASKVVGRPVAVPPEVAATD